MSDDTEWLMETAGHMIVGDFDGFASERAAELGETHLSNEELAALYALDDLAAFHREIARRSKIMARWYETRAYVEKGAPAYRELVTA